MDAWEWNWFHRRALAATIQAENTRRLWANPLSIYGPDPIRLAVVEFNAGLREQQREMRAKLDELTAAHAAFVARHRRPAPRRKRRHA